MALPPNIPTSFVPHPSERQNFRTDFSGTIPFLAYVIFAVSVVLAVGAFLYARVLSAEQAGKDAALSTAEQSTDKGAVENFVRLRNRLVDAKTLINGHVAFSNVLNALDTQLPATVRMNSIIISTDSTTGGVTLKGSGVAKTFNALAAASASFAGSGTIKNAIFAGLQVNTDNSVSFSLTATVDPSLVAYSVSAAPSSAPFVPTTVATTTSETATSSRNSSTTP